MGTGKHVAGVVAGSLILIGCGDGTDDRDSDSQGSTGAPIEDVAETELVVETEPDTVAVLAIITELIEAALGGTDFEPAESGQQLAVDDQVRTDDTGFAEVVYHDGSWQRVEANATLTIVELLDGEDRDVVRTAIDIGRTWNNVRELTAADDTYELETPVATASVRGTIFATDCESESLCTFTAVEGTVEIDPVEGEAFMLVAPAQVTIGGDDPGEPSAVAPDLLRLDPWIATNLELDVERVSDLPDRAADLSEAATTDQAQLATAAMAGTYDVTRTLVETNSIFEQEEVAERVYHLEVDCAGGDCTMQIAIETFLVSEDGSTQRDDLIIPVEYEGGSYAGSSSIGLSCREIGGEEDAPGIVATYAIDLSTVAASRTRLGWHSQAFEGRLTVSSVFDAGCSLDPPTVDGGDGLSVGTLDGVRRLDGG